MKNLSFILLTITLLFVAGFKGSCGSDSRWKNAGQGQVELSKKRTQTTPAGTRVYSENGDISKQVLDRIDTALINLFVDGRAEGYNENSAVFRSDFYEVYIPKMQCGRSPETNTPSFLIRADSYDGTVYDQHNTKGKGVKDGIGVIYAAEMVLGFNPGQMVVCPESEGAAYRHGAEHIIAAIEDPDYFNLTWFHGNGVNHPLYPKPQAKSDFTGSEARKFDGSKIIHAVR